MKFNLHSNDRYLSYKIHKNPATVFERKLRDNTTVTAKWDGDDFLGSIDHDIEQILLHCKRTNMASYNDSVFWVTGPYNLTAFSLIFSSALKGVFDESVPDNEKNKSYIHYMTIGPFSEFNEAKINKLIGGMGLFLTPIYSGSEIACNITFSGYMRIDEFLQKIFIFSYAYQYEFNLGLDTKDKLAKLRCYFENWIDTIDNPEYLLEILSGHRLERLSLLDEEYGMQRVATVAQRKEYSLHAQRHKIISDTIQKLGICQIIDAACGEGALLQQLELTEAQKYIGFDSDNRVRRIKSKGANNIKRFKANILFPLLKDDVYTRELETVMVLSEVIEHFDEKDRERLMMLVDDFYQPDYLIVTTPNYGYNYQFGIEGYRHHDHKIEFDIRTIEELVSGFYSYQVLDWILMDDDLELYEQPSFIILFKRTTHKDSFTIAKIENEMMFGKPEDNPKINRAINDGLCNRAIIKNYKDLFYLGPTIAPANSNDTELESIEEAIKYFESKNAGRLSFQEKVMGSRAYILWFKTLEEAEQHGYDKTLIVNSRNGFEFFDDAELLSKLEFEIRTMLPPYVKNIMLDCEITPWNLKAKGLIKREFQVPLEAELLHRQQQGNKTSEYEDVALALDALSTYAEDAPIKVHIFDVLAINNYNMLFYDIHYVLDILKFWMNNRNHDFEILEIVKFSDDYRYMQSICEYSEGIVVKPRFRTLDTIPAIKVRNSEYLRLIYGAHYQKYIQMLKDRPTNRKRAASVNQWQISNNMIDAFCTGNLTESLKQITLFFSNENTMTTDRTL